MAELTMLCFPAQEDIQDPMPKDSWCSSCRSKTGSWFVDRDERLDRNIVPRYRDLRRERMHRFPGRYRNWIGLLVQG